MRLDHILKQALLDLQLSHEEQVAMAQDLLTSLLREREGALRPGSALKSSETPHHEQLSDEERSRITLDAPETLLETIDDPSLAQSKRESQRLESIDLARDWPKVDPARFELLDPLGRGAMGEVWRVFDHLLHRHLALKLIREPHREVGRYLKRFREEAKLSAQLTHPSIITIYEVLRWRDGRLGFLMEEVDGSELGVMIRAVHERSHIDRWSEVDGWSLRRLVQALLQVCEAIAYAHQRGVLHRDLKPNNVMVGDHGQVWVLDWGIAHRYDHAQHDSSATSVDASARPPHRLGAITGTPYYMSPEQVEGHLEKLGPWSDVYALGAILYEIISGAPPYSGYRGLDVIKHYKEMPELSLRRDLSQRHQRPVSDELIELCERAIQRDYRRRIPDAASFASALREWLDGSKRHERALAEVHQALAVRARIDELLTTAQALERQAEEVLSHIPAWEEREKKRMGWSLEDQAQRLRDDIQRLQADEQRLTYAALYQEPSLIEARLMLAGHYQELHRASERSRQGSMAKAYEVTLEEHVRALPRAHPKRRAYERYLKGIATLKLTFAHHVTIQISQYQRVNRVLTPLHLRTLEGEAISLQLPIGSYLLEMSAPGRLTIQYPVYLERDQVWDHSPPDATPLPIELPVEGSLLPWERYVPGGWFESGGDPDTPNSAPARRVWVDSFAIADAPVTHREFLAFLNSLAARGDLESALEWAPREQTNSEERGALRYHLTGEGEGVRFSHPDGDQALELPVVSISWYSACAYADWLSAERLIEVSPQDIDLRGRGWRLPLELEFEKAARGVDRRSFPWGDDFDPSFCVMMDSHPHDLEMHPVRSKETDRSVYDVSDCAGNIREWCLDVYHAEGAPLANGRPRFPTKDELSSAAFRSSRGGSLGNSAIRTRCADRDWWLPHQSYLGRGFRVARSIG